MRIDPGDLFHQGCEYHLLGMSFYKDKSNSFDVIALTLRDRENPSILVSITMAEHDLVRIVTGLAKHKREKPDEG